MFSRPKILFLVSLLFVALLNPKFNPYLLFKFLIFYHSSIYANIEGFCRVSHIIVKLCDDSVEFKHSKYIIPGGYCNIFLLSSSCLSRTSLAVLYGYKM